MSKIRAGIAGIAAMALIGAAAVATTSGTAAAREPWARAQLQAADGTRVGTIAFVDESSTHQTRISVRLRDATATALDAFHGLHVHANDVTTNGDGCIADPTQPSSTWFVSAYGHWKHDPTEVHGNHAGDMPSVFVNADGTATMRFDVDKLTPNEVVGRAVVLHAGPDNFGNVPIGTGADQYGAGATAVAKTQATGNAGDRFACGVVEGN